MNARLVPINGQEYAEPEFFRRITDGYSSALLPAKRARGKKQFCRYIKRNICSPSLTRYLKVFYNAASPLMFNGIRHWDEEFKKTFTTLKQNASYRDCLNQFDYCPDTYLQNILVAKLQTFLAKNNIVEHAPCVSYRDYILRCIQYNYFPSVDIRWHKHKGWGLYALEDIYPFTFIGLYTGDIKFSLPLKLWERVRGLENEYKWALSFNEHLIIDASVAGNYTRFINHDSEQSQRIQPFSVDIASNETSVLPHRGFLSYFNEKKPFISFNAGEEIVWDYGPKFTI